MPIDYEILRFIWWLLLVILILGFTLTDGFDWGALVLLPQIGKNDEDRRTVLKAILPVWEGNQVWFILGGGAIFAAWPIVYAVSFSAFYLAMFLLLATFIVRPVALKYRDKKEHMGWRYRWDRANQISAILACLIFGIAVGNVMQGIPFEFDPYLRSFYTGSFWQLFNPFSLICSGLSLSMLCMHAGYYITCKTEGPLQYRAQHAARLSAFLVLIFFILGGYWITYKISGYTITGTIDHYGPSNPLLKMVNSYVGAWLSNYHAMPALWAFPILGILAAVFAASCAQWNVFAFICSGLSLTGILGTAAVALFPFILPSSSHPEMSLTVWDASSSHLGLWLMLLATLIFFPIVLSYTAWVYRVLRGKV